MPSQKVTVLYVFPDGTIMDASEYTIWVVDAEEAVGIDNWGDLQKHARLVQQVKDGLVTWTKKDGDQRKALPYKDPEARLKYHAQG